MAKLTAARRKRLPKSEFGLPSKAKLGPRGGASSGSFPIDTKARAINAKARAVQGVKAGTLSRADADIIIKRANTKLRKEKSKSIRSASELLNKR